MSAENRQGSRPLFGCRKAQHERPVAASSWESLAAATNCASENACLESVELQHSAHISRDRTSERLLSSPSRAESCFGAFSDDDKSEEELVERPYKPAGTVNAGVESSHSSGPVMIVPTQETEVQGGFDVCREYGYKYEYGECSSESEDGEEQHESPEFTMRKKSARSLAGQGGETLAFDGANNTMSQSEAKSAAPVARYVLGKQYHPIRDYDVRKEDEYSLFWFTYRCDFPEMVPYGITTDAGWGCMLRSAQMLLGQALRMHFRTRDWKPPKTLAHQRNDPFLRSIMTWFADFPSTSECWYSVHNMTAAGISKYETLPGEWYGPGTACHVLRDLCELHYQPCENSSDHTNNSDRQEGEQRFTLGRSLFRVHVATEGEVYRDEIENVMTRDNRRAYEKENPPDERKKHFLNDPLLHPLHPDVVEEEPKKFDWDTSLLLLVPLRLGLKSFNAAYAVPLAHTFSFPESVGFVGGSPRHALWFYGASADGSEVYGLDPHTVQDAPRKVHVSARRPGRTVSMSGDYLRSVHCSNPSRLRMHRIDPSLALAFYCRDKKEFDQLSFSLRTLNEWCTKNETPDLFTFGDNAPDYSDNAAMAAMLASGLSSTSQNDEQSFSDGEDDEEEYVML